MSSHSSVQPSVSSERTQGNGAIIRTLTPETTLCYQSDKPDADNWEDSMALRIVGWHGTYRIAMGSDGENPITWASAGVICDSVHPDSGVVFYEVELGSTISMDDGNLYTVERAANKNIQLVLKEDQRYPSTRPNRGVTVTVSTPEEEPLTDEFVETVYAVTAAVIADDAQGDDWTIVYNVQNRFNRLATGTDPWAIKRALMLLDEQGRIEWNGHEIRLNREAANVRAALACYRTALDALTEARLLWAGTEHTDELAVTDRMVLTLEEGLELSA